MGAARVLGPLRTQGRGLAPALTRAYPPCSGGWYLSVSNDTTQDNLLHSLELRKSATNRGSQPDRYVVDLLAQASWENPYSVRMQYSGEGADPGALSWEFPTEAAALRHIQVLVTRQERMGYTLRRVPRAHPYRAWIEGNATSERDASEEDDAQTTLF